MNHDDQFIWGYKLSQVLRELYAEVDIIQEKGAKAAEEALRGGRLPTEEESMELLYPTYRLVTEVVGMFESNPLFVKYLTEREAKSTEESE